MQTPCAITTSWDDGHPLDLRIADLLAKYGLAGTFYIPAAADTGVMTPKQVREISARFEVGAHTMHHVDLTSLPAVAASEEIVRSKQWVEEVTAGTCRMFCAPLGHFSSLHLPMIREAGFTGLRTVEMMSVGRPRRRQGVWVMPTTLQSHPHRGGAYLRNVFKRRSLPNLRTWLLRGRASEWTGAADSLLRHVLEHGGVFHLWGHSWEIEQHGQWAALEAVLRVMGQAGSHAARCTNAEVCLLEEVALAGPEDASGPPEFAPGRATIVSFDPQP